MADVYRKKIALIGSGFVGGAAGKVLSEKGSDVFFYDVKPEVIEFLRSEGFNADHMSQLSKKNDFDFFMISVPTPTIKGRVSLDFVESAANDLGRYLKNAEKFPVFVLRSTVPPGTTEELLIKVLEKISGKEYRKDFGVCMNPEFLREAKAADDFAKPWIIVIGSDDGRSGKLLDELYQPFGSPIVHMSIKEAEMTKYAHNLLNATKISFFNEMRAVNDAMGIDPQLEFKTVVRSAEAIWNPEYGTKDFGPFGGSCLPKDTSGFFTWAKEKFNLELPVLKGTIQTNEAVKKARSPECAGKRCGEMLGLLKISRQQH